MVQKAADMAASIWLLFCDIAAVGRDYYVDWFHRYYISEKLDFRLSHNFVCRAADPPLC